MTLPFIRAGRRGRRRCLAGVGWAALLLCAGCATTRPALTEAFPPARLAAPWVLRGEVWNGTFEQAAPSLGDDADHWRRLQPQHVWLAVYGHETRPERTLTVRCFAFASAEQARQAFEVFQPTGAKAFGAGDAGCWTEIGVLFQKGHLVFDVFGADASWDSEVQSALLTRFIEKRLPTGAADDPR